MNFKSLIAACLIGSAFTAFAQDSGVEYFRAGQLTNAKELLNRSLKQGGADVSSADYYLGLIAIAENDLTGARNYFQHGIDTEILEPYNYIGLGRLALINKDLKEAEKQFKAAENLSRKDASLLINIARAYYSTDPVAYAKQVEKYVEKARKADWKNVDYYLFEGDRKLDADDIGGAANMYEMGADYNPNATEAYAKYAELFTQVNPDFAIRMLNKLLQNNPESALGQRELANAYYNKQDYANAAKAYGTYVKNPNHFKQDEDRYAFLLFYGGDYKSGYEYATSLLATDPDNFTAQRYQFMNAAQMPEMKDQLLPLAEGLFVNHKKDPKKNKFASIDYMLISNEFDKAAQATEDPAQKEARFKEAVEILVEGATELPEQAGNMYKQLATVYVDMNQITNAADAFTKYVMATDSPNYNDYVQQAVYYFFSGVENKNNEELANQKYELSAEAANKAIADNPNGYRAVKVLGDIKKQKATAAESKSIAANDYQKSLDLIAQAENPSRYASDAANMALYLYNHYIESKQTDKAAAVVNQMLVIDPSNETFAKLK